MCSRGINKCKHGVRNELWSRGINTRKHGVPNELVRGVLATTTCGWELVQPTSSDLRRFGAARASSSSEGPGPGPDDRTRFGNRWLSVWAFVPGWRDSAANGKGGHFRRDFDKM
jgi:hypothetical protein